MHHCLPTLRRVRMPDRSFVVVGSARRAVAPPPQASQAPSSCRRSHLVPRRTRSRRVPQTVGVAIFQRSRPRPPQHQDAPSRQSAPMSCRCRATYRAHSDSRSARHRGARGSTDRPVAETRAARGMRLDPRAHPARSRQGTPSGTRGHGTDAPPPRHRRPSALQLVRLQVATKTDGPC